jgi:flagellar hook-associated protein 3 FlgL
MRVTANTFPDTLISQLGQLASRQNRLQSQAATGQRVQLPEDDPTAMRRVLDLKTETATLSQYQNNISNLKSSSTASYDAMRSLKTISDRAGEIATLADGTKSQDELNAYATELNQLLEQGMQLVNSKYSGVFLFGGTLNNQAPFVATTTSDQITAVAYQGNANSTAAEIAENTTLAVQVPGENNSGAGPRGLITDSRSGADFFAHLINLRDNLQNGNTAAIANTDRANLSKDEDNFLFQFSTIGVVQARLDTASSIAANRIGSLNKIVSNEADADLAQTLVKLGETQNAYQAALQSGATILNHSLLDYLQ